MLFSYLQPALVISLQAFSSMSCSFACHFFPELATCRQKFAYSQIHFFCNFCNYLFCISVYFFFPMVCEKIIGFPRPFQDHLHSKTFSCFGTACCRLPSNSLWVGCLSWWVLCDTSLETAVCVCQDDFVLKCFYYGKHS